MPHIPSVAIGSRERPTNEPHLGLATINGTWLPIKPGNVLAFIEDPGSALKIVPVMLVAVDHKKMEVKCACGQANCTRTATFRASWKGHHPKVER